MNKEELNEYFDNIQNNIDNEPWYEKISDFFEYTIWKNGIVLFYYNVKWYFKNLWSFQKQIWSWRPWDGDFVTKLFVFGLKQLRDHIDHHGHEERVSANKKIAAINDLIYQLERDIDEEIHWDKDAESLEEWSNRYNDARNERFDKIARIIKGQDIREYRKDQAIKDDKESYDHFVEWFDGTGIDGWWD